MTRYAPLRRRFSSAFSVLALVASGFVATVALAPVADAAVSPIAEVGPASVTAKALPTAQIDGVAWAQAISNNNTVWVGGQFTQARPAGAAPGVNTSPRNNVMAYDLATGVMKNFAVNPTVNAQIRTVAVSPDGTRVYFGGDFTSANGATRYRIAAYDTATGALISSFAPYVDYVVNAIDATNTTVYIGGSFSNAGGSPRAGLAAFGASNGALLAWAPTATIDPSTTNKTSQVMGLQINPDGSKVVVAGSFGVLDGVKIKGIGAVSAVDGTLASWATYPTVYSAGDGAAIYSLTGDGTKIYGTAYNYYGDGNIEGAFAMDGSTGAVQWVEDCHGDTYDAFAGNGYVYTVSHAHYCGNVGGFPQTNPLTHHHALAFTADATGTIQTNPLAGYANWAGTPSPSLVNWFPDLTPGTYTGLTQAAWSVTGTSQYLALGGEFPSVNGTAQQGLVRFGLQTVTNKGMPPALSGADMVPKLLALKNGNVRVSLSSDWDPDDMVLTYKFFKNGNTTTPVYQVTANSTFWNRPNIGFFDSNVTAGSPVSYRVQIDDPDGNTVWGDGATVTPTAGAPASRYSIAIAADGASTYWPLNETSGSVAYDNIAFNDADEGAGVTPLASGAIPGDSAASFSGTPTGFMATRTPIAGPDTFSISAWFKTTSTSGGKIVGFGDKNTGNSSTYDRHIYMDPSGKVYFGVYNSGSFTINTPAAYNDGQWHQAVGTLSASGMVLYLDGKKVGTNTGTTVGQAYSGYWRVGGDSSWSGNPYFNGGIDDVAIFPTALTPLQVNSEWVASGRTSTLPTAPPDAYGTAVFNDNPSLYYRLGESSGTAAADSGPAGPPGTYSGGYTFGATGAITGTTNTAVTFDGSAGEVYSNTSVSGPTTYSEELWFSTTSTKGGKLIGFGNSKTGLSTSYDRQVYMVNNGQLTFGTHSTQINTATTTASYNDGKWHHVVATQGGDGMKLYVDGGLAATNAATTALPFSGYWRLGGDNLTSWPGAPTSNYIAGTLDEAAVYSTVLTPTQVLAHFHAAGRNSAPVASFTSTPTNLSVAFDGSASSDPDGTVASYSWDFGDNTAVGTGSTPTHVYASAGTYQVKLTVTDNGGATASATKPVTVTAPVNHPPTAAFTVTTTGLALKVDGTTSTDPDGPISSYAWAFGDGSTGIGSTTTHTYAAAGTYPVTLTVTDAGGLTGKVSSSVTVAPLPPNKPPVAAFTSTVSALSVNLDGSTSTDPDGTVASWSWNFGDNTPAGTGSKLSHTYADAGTYHVTLTVKDDNGATDSVTHDVVVTSPPPVNQPPTAAFTSSSVDLVASFDGSTSKDPDGTIASYSWDFGDNSAGSASVKPTHTYTAAGTYHVSLTVTDNQGATDKVTSTITVSAPPPANVPPVAAFTVTTSNLTANFDGSTSSDPDGTVAAYSWNFGDNSAMSTLTKPSHTYALAGTYQVTLTVTDNKGAINSVTHPVTTATGVNQPPVAAFTSTTMNLVASFDGTTSSDPDGTVVSYSWDFGDHSGASTAVKPSHTYAAPGTYHVILTVTDNGGATNSVTKSVTVSAAAPVVYASDQFGRTLAAGLGTADQGGSWTLLSPASQFAVNGNVGQFKMPTAGAGPQATLGSVSQRDVDSTYDLSLDSLPTGAGMYVTYSVRKIGNSQYWMRILIQPSGALTLYVSKIVNGAETNLGSTPIAGLTLAANDVIKVRFTVVGSGTTALSAKVWRSGSTEPTTAQVSATDSEPSLQAPGSVVLWTYLSSSAIHGSVASFDNLRIQAPTA